MIQYGSGFLKVHVIDASLLWVIVLPHTNNHPYLGLDGQGNNDTIVGRLWVMVGHKGVCNAGHVSCHIHTQHVNAAMFHPPTFLPIRVC